MKKRNISIISLITLSLINSVSAQFYGGYNRFSLTGLLDSINPSTMILGVLFIIFFAFINMSLGKVFKNQYGEPNKAIAGVVAFAVTTLIIYGINRYGFDIEGLFYGLGLSSDLLYILLLIILFIGAIFIYLRFKFRGLFLIFGLLLMLLTVFTDIFYEKGITFVIGAILFIIGLWLWGRGRDPQDRLGRYQAKRELKELKRQDFQRRADQYTTTIGRGAATAVRGWRRIRGRPGRDNKTHTHNHDNKR